MITVRAPSGDKAVAAVTVRTPTGDKAVARMVLRTPTGDKEFYTAAGAGGLTVTADPLSAIGTAYVEEVVFVTTNLVTATATGGTAPYTYAWTRTDGPVGFDAMSPSAAATRFRASLNSGESAFGIFRVTATDARGRTGFVDVDASVYNLGRL